jgi:lipopolysaccharide export system ATP-binding protein
MLDEPFAGIDPVTVQSIQEIILRLARTGIAILITDHAAREILATVDRCYVISKGLVLKEGTPEEVKQHPEVRRQYLGNMDGDWASSVPEPHLVKSASSAKSTSPRRTFLRRRTDV